MVAEEKLDSATLIAGIRHAYEQRHAMRAAMNASVRVNGVQRVLEVIQRYLDAPSIP